MGDRFPGLGDGGGHPRSPGGRRSRTIAALTSPNPPHPLALACGLLTAGAGSAQAASITVDGGKLVVRAAPGEKNWVNVNKSQYEPGLLELDDLVAFQYDPSLCHPAYGEGFKAVVCTPQPGGVVIDADDGDDIVNTGDVGATITIAAGPATTSCAAARASRSSTAATATTSSRAAAAPTSSLGGAGDDPMLEGQGGADVVRGGDGDDTLRGDKHNDPSPPTCSTAGRLRPDRRRLDRRHGQHQPPIAVSEDGQANDGRPGEGDNVGGHRADLPQRSRLAVGDGEDDEYTVFNTDATPSALAGGGGNDKLSAFDYDDTVDGGAGDDTLTGGYGNDTITGGPGRDTIYADVSSTTCHYIQCRLPQGNDTVKARDGEADQIDCGVGTDTAYVDPPTPSPPARPSSRATAPRPVLARTVRALGPGPGPGGALSATARTTSLPKALARGLVLDARVPAAGTLTVVARKGGRAVARRQGQAAQAGAASR